MQAQTYGHSAPMYVQPAQAPAFGNQAPAFGNQASTYGNQAPFGNQMSPYGNQAAPIVGHPAQGYGQPTPGFAHPTPTNPFQTSPIASGHFGAGSQPLLSTQPLLTSQPMMTSPGFSMSSSMSPKYADSSLSPKYGAFDQISNQGKNFGQFGFEGNRLKLSLVEIYDSAP